MKTELEIWERKKPTKERMSSEEFLAWADEDAWAEWEDGKVFFISPAGYLHQSIVRFLAMLIGLFLEEHDMGVVLPAPFAMYLPISKRIHEPDWLVILEENLEGIKENHLDGPANLVVEILSEESILRDRGTNFAEYEIDGVCEYWVIDSERKQADLFLFGEGGRFERKFARQERFLSQ